MRSTILALVLLLAAAIPASAQTPQTLSWQGALLDDQGAVVPDGSYSLTLRIYSAASGGLALYTETQPAVAVTRGSFSVLIGSVTPINLAFDVPYWLGVQVGAGEELAPRVPLASSPYAFGLRLPFAGGANGSGAAFTVRNNNGPALLADGTIRTGSTTATGRVLGYPQGGTSPVFELHSATNGGLFRLRDDQNFTYGQLEGDVSGTGAFFSVARAQAGAAFTVDGNFGGTEEPRVSITGSARSAVFDMSQSGDDAVILPSGSVNAVELANEPGVAASIASAPFALTGIDQNMLLRTITCPTDGYVVAVATGHAQFTHNMGTFSQAVFSVSDVSGVDGNHTTPFQVSGNAPTGTYATPVSVQAVFPVLAGPHTFYFTGRSSSTDIDVSSRSLTLMFFPTAYGTVTSGLAQQAPEGGRMRASEPSLDPARERLEAARFDADRLQGEMRAMQARLDRLSAELERSRAAQASAAAATPVVP